MSVAELQKNIAALPVGPRRSVASMGLFAAAGLAGAAQELLADIGREMDAGKKYTQPRWMRSWPASAPAVMRAYGARLLSGRAGRVVVGIEATRDAGRARSNDLPSFPIAAITACGIRPGGSGRDAHRWLVLTELGGSRRVRSEARLIVWVE